MTSRIKVKTPKEQGPGGAWGMASQCREETVAGGGPAVLQNLLWGQSSSMWQQQEEGWIILVVESLGLLQFLPEPPQAVLSQSFSLYPIACFLQI